MDAWQQIMQRPVLKLLFYGRKSFAFHNCKTSSLDKSPFLCKFTIDTDRIKAESHLFQKKYSLLILSFSKLTYNKFGLTKCWDERHLRMIIISKLLRLNDNKIYTMRDR